MDLADRGGFEVAFWVLVVLTVGYGILSRQLLLAFVLVLFLGLAFVLWRLLDVLERIEQNLRDDSGT